MAQAVPAPRLFPGGLSPSNKGQLMFKNMEEIQKLNKNQFEAVSAVASNFAKGLKQLADETAEFTKKHYDASTITAEKFFGAKSLGARPDRRCDGHCCRLAG
jgi:hypothetical protein